MNGETMDDLTPIIGEELAKKIYTTAWTSLQLSRKPGLAKFRKDKSTETAEDLRERLGQELLREIALHVQITDQNRQRIEAGLQNLLDRIQSSPE